MKNLFHLDQVRKNGLILFDYGKERNLIEYDNEYPPLLDTDELKDVLKDIPILCLNGKSDLLIDELDRKILRDKLPEHSKWIELEDYNHLELIWSKFSYRDINPHIQDFLNE